MIIPIPMPIYQSSGTIGQLPPLFAIFLIIIWICIMSAVLIITIQTTKDFIELKDTTMAVGGVLVTIAMLLFTIISTIGLIVQNFT